MLFGASSFRLSAEIAGYSRGNLTWKRKEEVRERASGPGFPGGLALAGFAQTPWGAPASGRGGRRVLGKPDEGRAFGGPASAPPSARRPPRFEVPPGPWLPGRPMAARCPFVPFVLILCHSPLAHSASAALIFFLFLYLTDLQEICVCSSFRLQLSPFTCLRGHCSRSLSLFWSYFVSPEERGPFLNGHPHLLSCLSLLLISFKIHFTIYNNVLIQFLVSSLARSLCLAHRRHSMYFTVIVCSILLLPKFQHHGCLQVT